MPEGRHLFRAMTVTDTLRIAWEKRRESVRDVPAILYVFPKLKTLGRSYARNLSGGEQQMLAIGRGLLLNPHILMLDEPSAGLSPRLVSTVVKVVEDLVAGGLAVLLAEQNVHAARHLSHRVVLFERGSLRESGDPELLGDDSELRLAYFGGDADGVTARAEAGSEVGHLVGRPCRPRVRLPRRAEQEHAEDQEVSLMHPVGWHIDMEFDEDDTRTHAAALLRLRDGTELRARGDARRHPDDQPQAWIGEEIAAARALSDLAHQLLDKAAGEISEVTHRPATIAP